MPEPWVARVTGAEAVRLLIKHTYRRHFVVGSLASAHFERLGAIARQVPVYVILRPRSADSTRFVVSSISRIITEMGQNFTDERDGFKAGHSG